MKNAAELITPEKTHLSFYTKWRCGITFSGKESIDDTAVLIKAHLIKQLYFALPICLAPGFFKHSPWMANLHSIPFLPYPHIPLQAPVRAGGTQGLQKMKADKF